VSGKSWSIDTYSQLHQGIFILSLDNTKYKMSINTLAEISPFSGKEPLVKTLNSKTFSSGGQG